MRTMVLGALVSRSDVVMLMFRIEVRSSAAWVIHALRVAHELRRIEVHVAQIARAVAQRLIVEVFRRRIAALAAGSDGARAHAVSEVDHGHEAVPARAVQLLRLQRLPRAERCERSPSRRREAHWNARLLVVERMVNVIGEPLKAIDVAPMHLPRAE